MRIQPKGDLLPEAIVKLPGNCTNGVRSCAKFDAHTHYHCQGINRNRHYLQLVTFAMAIIVLYYTYDQNQ